MWMVIYIAAGAKAAGGIRDKLTEEGFLVKLRPTNAVKEQYEILVPESEIEEVQEILKDIMHSSSR